MTEVCEGVFVPPPPEEPKEESEDPKKSISIRCSLFFDGTLNNRTNTQARKDNTKEYNATKSLWHRATGFGDGKGDGSYENDETNIARMEPFIEEAEGYDVSLKVYTEGPGTIDNRGDKTVGYAIGAGLSGVEMKVWKAIFDAVGQIQKDRKPERFIINKLTFDVFGFSRGAAGARFCIHCLLHDKNRTIKKILEDLGFQVETVEVCFAGLYDTVSSHGLSFSNDTSTLKLDAVRHAKKVVQLAAADEHRRNFSLTNIDSALCKGGDQYFLPGAHSDVGGSYLDGDSEEHVVFIGSRGDAIEERKTWIADGWYKEDEIDPVSTAAGPRRPVQERLGVVRKNIRNAYCLIPLKVMTRFARENGLNVKARLDKNASAQIKGFDELTKLEARIDAHLAGGSADSKPEAWHGRDPLLCKVRHDHMHVSAKYEFGLTPRFKKGKRYREQYDG